jgi:hypothetical protein
MNPPLLPSEALRRVLRVARFDGMSVLGVAGAFALASGASRDVSGAVIGLLVAAAGAIELHGVSLIKEGRPSGMRWLILSQAYLLATILAYAGYRFARPSIDWIKPYVTQDIVDLGRQNGLTVDELLTQSFQSLYVMVALATLVYQGGMMIYYLRRRASVERAVRELEEA